VRYLIVSDIHANLEGLNAVLAANSGLYDQILCCGDFVDYGASPNEICDWARANCAAVIRGNHDKACCGLDNTDDYNPLAQAAVIWTMKTLTPANTEWLRGLPKGPVWIEDSFQLVHGSPYDEDEYLLDVPEIIRARQSMQAPLVFFGHTHLQGAVQFQGEQGGVIPAVPGNESAKVVQIQPGSYYLVNPGSTGQPRDRDWRAGCALYDSLTKELVLRRVEYDVAGAQRRIVEAGLPPALADRLSRGQ
jgi:diadenosine tetraphosphatase ApaH/serine/threonine PP2A family protein phosphatase